MSEMGSIAVAVRASPLYSLEDVLDPHNGHKNRGRRYVLEPGYLHMLA